MSTQIRTPPSFFGTATIGISSAYSLISETDCSACCTETLVIESFTHMLTSKKVKVFTDNQNTVRMAIFDSEKLDLHAIAVQLYHHCFSRKIFLECQWIHRQHNKTVDSISRIVNLDDWQLNPKLFQILDSKWGPHSLDRFASPYNTQLARFNSRSWSPGAEAIDAFSLDWSQENNWLCPPFVCLITKVISDLRACSAQGTLIVPFFWSFHARSNRLVYPTQCKRYLYTWQGADLSLQTKAIYIYRDTVISRAWPLL